MNEEKWSIWYYIRSYKFNSIFIKTFLLVVLPTLLPLILISVSIYNYNSANIREQIKTANINSLSKIKNMVDMVALESERISSRFVSDSDIQILLSNPFKNSDYYTYDKFQDLNKILSIITTTNDVINSVYVYFEESKFVLATDGYSMELEHFPDSDWIESYKSFKTSKSSWFEPRAVNMPFGYKTQYYLSNFRSLSYYNLNGAVIVNIDLQKLKNIIDNVNDSKQHNLLIIKEDGTILYNKDTSIISKNIKEIESLKRLSLEAEKSYLEDNIEGIDGLDQLITILDSDYNKWRYIFITPANQYSQRTEEFKRFMFFSIGVSLILALCIAFFISIRVFQPIKNMLSLLDTPQEWEGILKIDDEKNLNEFKYLAKGFLKSLDRTRKMEEAMAERLALLRKAQSVALQAQINPHFLYNTLETANWKAMGLTGGENEVSDMLASLSQLLRLSLETENSLVTILKEIEHAKLYVDIQKIRYRDKFEVLWNIDADILNYKIVKLSIQPLIENAIYHGIKPKKEKGTISISGTVCGEGIIIKIMDDGVGLLDENVQVLNMDMKDEYIKEDLHIGMKNVNQRLKLIFGDEYGLSVESELKKYTLVKIHIPKVE
jgi:two-component system, sensor histidine kinase YesM